MRTLRFITIVFIISFVTIGCGKVDSDIPYDEVKSEVLLPTDSINPLGENFSTIKFVQNSEINEDIKKQANEFTQVFFDNIKDDKVGEIPVYLDKNEDYDSSMYNMMFYMLNSSIKDSELHLIDEFYGESLTATELFSVEYSSDESYHFELPVLGYRYYQIYEFRQGIETYLLFLAFQYDNEWKFQDFSTDQITIGGKSNSEWENKANTLRDNGYIIPACLLYKGILSFNDRQFLKHNNTIYLDEIESFFKQHEDKLEEIKLTIDGSKYKELSLRLRVGQTDGLDIYEITYISNIHKLQYNNENIELEANKVNNYLLDNKIIYDVDKFIYHVFPQGTTKHNILKKDYVTIEIE